ncbi:hypothetical protein [Caulobacter sp. LARHSG274]
MTVKFLPGGYPACLRKLQYSPNPEDHRIDDVESRGRGLHDIAVSGGG